MYILYVNQSAATLIQRTNTYISLPKWACGMASKPIDCFRSLEREKTEVPFCHSPKHIPSSHSPQVCSPLSRSKLLLFWNTVPPPPADTLHLQIFEGFSHRGHRLNPSLSKQQKQSIPCRLERPKGYFLGGFGFLNPTTFKKKPLIASGSKAGLCWKGMPKDKVHWVFGTSYSAVEQTPFKPPFKQVENFKPRLKLP